MPALIIGTYDENGVPNAMNAAWSGICRYKEIIIDLAEPQNCICKQIEEVAKKQEKRCNPAFLFALINHSSVAEIL